MAEVEGETGARGGARAEEWGVAGAVAFVVTTTVAAVVAMT